MPSITMFIVCLAFMLPAGIGLAHAPADQVDCVTASTSSPVVYVYVTRSTHIDGFGVSSSGKLTPVPGSPFKAGISSMSVNKKFLFGPNNNEIDIDTFSISSDGALKLVSTIKAHADNPYGCGNFWPVQIDDTGSTLYNQVAAGCRTTLFFQSFEVAANGDLQFIGNVVDPVPGFAASFCGAIDFLGTNNYAYQTACVDFNRDFGAAPVAFGRKSSGLCRVLHRVEHGFRVRMAL